MSAPVIASGISIQPSTVGSHVVLCLHDQDQSPLIMILMSPAEAEAVAARLAQAMDAAASTALGLTPTMAVN